MEEITTIKFDDLKELVGEKQCISPEEYDYWIGRKHRTFFIDYEIDEDYHLIDLSKTIVNMNIQERNIPKEELKPIYIFVHSYGGEIEQALYFSDLLKASRIPIVTIGAGVCMSAGFFILISGHRRYMFKHCQALIHSGSGAFQGTAEQIEEAQKNYKRQLELIKKYILENTEIPEKVITKNKAKDWYLSSTEVTQYNIAKIITSFEDIE